MCNNVTLGLKHTRRYAFNCTDHSYISISIVKKTFFQLIHVAHTYINIVVHNWIQEFIKLIVYSTSPISLYFRIVTLTEFSELDL